VSWKQGWHRVPPARIIMDGKVVEDMFPQWNLIMLGNRIDIGKPKLTNITPTQPRDSRACNDVMSTAIQPRDWILHGSVAALLRLAIVRQDEYSRDAHYIVGNHAPERKRFEKERTVSKDSRSKPYINCPWDM
jgi:hypothetical protein